MMRLYIVYSHSLPFFFVDESSSSVANFDGHPPRAANMPPKAVTFPLGASNRDACLRCMHLPPKANRAILQRVYVMLYKKMALDDEEDSSEYSSKETQVLACSFLLLVIWKCYEEQSLTSQHHQSEIPLSQNGDDDDDDCDDPAESTQSNLTNDKFFLLRNLVTDYVRLMRLLPTPQLRPAPPSLLVSAKLLQEHVRGLVELPKWMRASSLGAVATTATDDGDEDEDAAAYDKMDVDEETKSDGNSGLTSSPASPLLHFVRKVVQGLIENTSVLFASFCFDFGPLWDRMASSAMDPLVWTHHIQQMGNFEANVSDDNVEPNLLVLGEQAVQNEAQVMMLLQKYTWQMGCYRASVLHADTADSLPTREERLLTSCGAVAFVLALNRLMSNKNEQEGPTSKKPRKEHLLEAIRDAAVETKTFSRWGSDGIEVNKFQIQLSVDDIQQEVMALAKTVYGVITKEPAVPTESRSKTALQNDSASSWIDELLVAMPDNVSPQKAIHYLPATATALFNSTLENLSRRQLDPKNIEYVNEATLPEMNSMETVIEGAEEFQVVETENDSVLGSPVGANARRVVTPPVLTDNMELNEWAVSLLYVETVKPSRQLKELLDLACEGTSKKWSDVIVPTLNRVVLRLSQENMLEKTTRIAPVTVDPETGMVEVSGDSTPEKQVCTAVIALFYHSLEAILYCESVRLSDRCHPTLIFNGSFQKSLLTCCILCVLKAVGVTQKIRPGTNLQSLQIYAVLPITETTAYEFLKVSESFLRSLTANTARGHLGSPLVFTLPKILVKDMQRSEGLVMDSLLWARDNKFPDSMVEKIEDFQEKTTDEKGSVCLWPPQVLVPAFDEPGEDDCLASVQWKYPTADNKDYAEFRCVSYLLRRVLKTANDRIHALCAFLGIPPHLPIARQVWVAFRYILRCHTYLLFDRHVDHWLLCCLYGVCRTLKYQPTITFARIIDAYVVIRGPEVGDVTCQRIVRHIKILDDVQQPIGDVIYLYNKVFLWKAYKHLLKSKTILAAAEAMANVQAKPSEAGGQVNLNSPDDAHLKKTQESLLGQSDRPASQHLFEVGKVLPSDMDGANTVDKSAS